MEVEVGEHVDDEDVVDENDREGVERILLMLPRSAAGR